MSEAFNEECISSTPRGGSGGKARVFVFLLPYIRKRASGKKSRVDYIEIVCGQRLLQCDLCACRVLEGKGGRRGGRMGGVGWFIPGERGQWENGER